MARVVVVATGDGGLGGPRQDGQDGGGEEQCWAVGHGILLTR